MSHKEPFRLKAHQAIIILLFVTIISSVAAFLWISTIEVKVVHKQLYIDKVSYEADDDLKLTIVNGLAVSIPVKENGAPAEQTVVTIYPKSGEGIDCDFVTLVDLSCSGDCDQEIAPQKKAELTFKGNRDKCILEEGKDYYLNLFFGLRAPVSTEFRVE